MATITGVIKLPNDVPFVGDILFRPLSTPLGDSPDIITTADVRIVTDSAGNFSLTLRAGNYSVLAGISRPFKITVPDTASTYAILSLITSGLRAVPDFVAPSGGGDLFASNNLAELTNLITARRNLGIEFADTLTALRAVPSSAKNKLAILLGQAALGDGLQWGIYAWLTSSALDNGSSIIRPNDYTTSLWSKIV
jgi:hypothetical protein